jgi:hypothetical protein
VIPERALARRIVIEEIERFPFWDHGMDDIDHLIREDRRAQHWIERLADRITARLDKEAMG